MRLKVNYANLFLSLKNYCRKLLGDYYRKPPLSSTNDKIVMFRHWLNTSNRLRFSNTYPYLASITFTALVKIDVLYLVDAGNYPRKQASIWSSKVFALLQKCLNICVFSSVHFTYRIIWILYISNYTNIIVSHLPYTNHCVKDVSTLHSSFSSLPTRVSITLLQ